MLKQETPFFVSIFAFKLIRDLLQRFMICCHWACSSRLLQSPVRDPIRLLFHTLTIALILLTYDNARQDSMF